MLCQRAPPGNFPALNPFVGVVVESGAGFAAGLFAALSFLGFSSFCVMSISKKKSRGDGVVRASPSPRRCRGAIPRTTRHHIFSHTSRLKFFFLYRNIHKRIETVFFLIVDLLTVRHLRSARRRLIE